MNGSFKSYVNTATFANPVDITVELLQPETVMTVAIVACAFG